jgi:hypothetical protein
MRFVMTILAVAGLTISAGAEPAPHTNMTVTVGAGVAYSDIPEDNYQSYEAARSFTPGWALRVDVARFVHPQIAVGVHAAISRAQGLDTEHRSMFNVDWEFSYSPVELGLTAQLVIDRFWLAPWVGVHGITADDGYLADWVTSPSLGLGLAAGGTVYRDGVHRVDLFASATRSVKHDADYGTPEGYDETFLGFAVGIAYRR